MGEIALIVLISVNSSNAFLKLVAASRAIKFGMGMGMSRGLWGNFSKIRMLWDREVAGGRSEIGRWGRNGGEGAS